jgi:hypothetical protein
MTQDDASWGWPEPGTPENDAAEPLDAGISNPETLEQPEAPDPALAYADEPYGLDVEPSHEHEERAEQEFES